jgi:hypothetical protein
MIITCEYCGSSITLGNSGWANIQKQTMLPLKIPTTDQITSLVRSMMDKGLLNRHLQESSTLDEMNTLACAVLASWSLGENGYRSYGHGN